MGVVFRLGGRATRCRYAGSFATKREALVRRAWVAGELAAKRFPDIHHQETEPERQPTLREATEQWRKARIEVSEGTRTNDKVNTERVFSRHRELETSPIDRIDAERWRQVFADLAAVPYKRETLKKSKEAFGMVYDHHGIDPNPLKDRRVKLPWEKPEDLVVPIATHVEAVARSLPNQHLLGYLLIDWTALRISAIEGAKVGDLDERRRSLLARRSIAKSKKAQWVELHEVLLHAIVARLPPREDRDLDAPLLPGFKGSALRTAITRACRLTGTPHFSPHGLRKRRGSLLSKQGLSLAEVAERLGDTKVIAAEHYLFAIGDYAEVDYAAVLADRG